MKQDDERYCDVLIHCTYDPATKGGNAPDGRKVKGTIHWVEASNAGKATVRLYENIVDEEKGVYNKEDGSLNVNPNSLTTVTAYVEPALMEAKGIRQLPVRKKRILLCRYPRLQRRRAGIQPHRFSQEFLQASQKPDPDSRNYAKVPRR